MNITDTQRIIARYNDRLEKHGPGISALASGTEERRKIRFDVLIDIGITPGSKVLDLGCGLGDFASYLDSKGLDIDYTGVDINPNLIELAKEHHPDKKFICADIQTEDCGKFDYIVSTSCFNLKLENENNYAFISSLLKRCYEISSKGVAIDFLSKWVDFQGNPEEAFYYDAGKCFDIAKNITKRVCLRHDYPLFEFCLYLYPDFNGWN